MAELKPLVDIDGQTQELPAGDSIAGAGTISGALVFNGILNPPIITNNEDDYSPTDLENNSVLRLNLDANHDITGIDSSNVIGGQTFIIVNVSTKDIKFKNNNANSLALNRFMLKADLTIQEDESVTLWYDDTSNRWRAASTYQN